MLPLTSDASRVEYALPPGCHMLIGPQPSGSCYKVLPCLIRSEHPLILDVGATHRSSVVDVHASVLLRCWRSMQHNLDRDWVACTPLLHPAPLHRTLSFAHVGQVSSELRSQCLSSPDMRRSMVGVGVEGFREQTAVAHQRCICKVLSPDRTRLVIFLGRAQPNSPQSSPARLVLVRAFTPKPSRP